MQSRLRGRQSRRAGWRGGEARRGGGEKGRRELGPYSTNGETSHIRNVLPLRNGFRSRSGSCNSARDGGAKRSVTDIERLTKLHREGLGGGVIGGVACHGFAAGGEVAEGEAAGCGEGEGVVGSELGLDCQGGVGADLLRKRGVVSQMRGVLQGGG